MAMVATKLIFFMYGLPVVKTARLLDAVTPALEAGAPGLLERVLLLRVLVLGGLLRLSLGFLLLLLPRAPALGRSRHRADGRAFARPAGDGAHGGADHRAAGRALHRVPPRHLRRLHGRRRHRGVDARLLAGPGIAEVLVLGLLSRVLARAGVDVHADGGGLHRRGRDGSWGILGPGRQRDGPRKHDTE